jgi:hypothetical protein
MINDVNGEMLNERKIGKGIKAKFTHSSLVGVPSLTSNFLFAGVITCKPNHQSLYHPQLLPCFFKSH